jgi:hypothetical protein
MAHGRDVRRPERAMLSVFMTLAAAGCLAPPVYWAESIRGRVVDADTGAPIEGAVVVANWRLYSGGMGHGGHMGSLLVDGTKTDTKGDFRFHKWGPKLRPYGTELDTAPWMVVFKRGYAYRYLENEHASNSFLRRSEWTGHTIELKPFRGTPKEHIENLDMVLSLSGLHPLLLREILAEKPLERSWPPGSYATFEHVQRLLTGELNEDAKSDH